MAEQGAVGAVVVGDGDCRAETLHAVISELGGRDGLLLIGADGGARRLEAAGLLLDMVVGDADSLSQADIERYRSLGAVTQIHAPEKDETDLELALNAALERRVRQARICGALGGNRIEHEVANLFLLGHPMLDGLDVAIVDDISTIRRTGTQNGPGEVSIRGAAGDYVSLQPLDPVVRGITTEGLRYPLRSEDLHIGPTRGISNEFLGEVARVTASAGRLLVIHTRRPAGREGER